MLQQLAQKLVRGIGHGVVEADAAADKDLLDARQLAQVAQQLGVAALVDHHVLAHARPQASLVLAYAVLELLVAGGTAKVGRRPAHVVDIALKLGIAREQLGLAHDRVVAAHLQHATLVEGERAKRALAKTAAVGADRKLDLGKGRHAARCVVIGMPIACVGELGHLVHLVGGERRRRRVLHHIDAVGVGLYQAMSGDGVHILLLHVKAARVVELVGGKVVPTGQQVIVVDLVERTRAVDGAIDIGNLIDGQSRVERVGDLDNRVLAHAVDEDVGARVEQYRALELVLPVVVVGQATQACLDAADDDGGVLECLADEVAVDRDGTVGAVSLLATGGIGVGVAAVLGHRIVVDHGVHVAGADEKAQARLAEHGDAGGVGPVGLADDAHLVAVRVEDAADDGHAKAGMVHVGVAADVDKVALVPAARIHVGAADGEELIAARAPGADRRCRGMRGARALGFASTLLLLAALGMLAVLVVLSVLGLFCHDSSRCLYAARNCNQSFWDGAKKTGGVHEVSGVDAAPVVCFQTVYLRVGESVSRARHVVNGLQYERRLCFRQRTRGSSTRRAHDDAACQTDIGVY